MNPAEIVAANVALILSPLLIVIIHRSSDEWSLKAIGMASLICLMISTVQRLREDERGQQ